MTAPLVWRKTGWNLANDHPLAAKQRELLGLPNDDALRVALVGERWPHIGEHIKRHIRAGWRAQRRGEGRP